jgi:hypothetical protein
MRDIMTSNTNPLIEHDSQFFYEKITNSIELLPHLPRFLPKNYPYHET